MKKTTGICITLLAAAGILLGPATAAHADDPATDQLQQVEAYGTLHWQVDNPLSIWQVPQHDPVWVPTGPVVDLTAGRDQLACGRYFQSDGEIDGPVTTALYAGGAGLLYGPGNPQESHAYGAPGTNGLDPWTYWDSPDCVEVTCADEFNQTTTTFRWVWDEATQGVVRSDTGMSTAPLTEDEAIAAGCYVQPVTPPTDPPVDECGTADTLACTGANDWVIWLAFGLLGLGVIVAVSNWMFGRVHKDRRAQ